MESVIKISLDERKRIDQLLENELNRGEKIAIFGGGFHTELLIKYTTIQD